jgi:light-dependent protochlorophyllide reductase
MRIVFSFTLPLLAFSFSFLGGLKIPTLENLQHALTPSRFGDKKLCIITGTSSGLGKQTARQLLTTGNWHVIGAVRDLDKMNEVAIDEGFDLSSFTAMECNLSSFASVRKFAKDVIALKAGRPIDRLVFNAAVYQPTLDYAKWSEDNIEQQLQTNYLSHFLMCSLLMPEMKESKDPRVIAVGSVTGNDNTVRVLMNLVFIPRTIPLTLLFLLRILC